MVDRPFELFGGKLRKLAQKIKEETEELEENMVDVRREDKTIRKFEIPLQEDLSGNIVEIRSIKIIKKHEAVTKELEKDITKKMHVIISGPNGIGKSTFLRNLVSEKPEGLKIAHGVRLGYYSQDFSNLDLEQTVFDSLKTSAFNIETEQDIRSLAAGFLLSGSLMAHKVGALSEGQKGLLAFARLVLMRPGLLVLDEPTNHINFRHLPIIAEAINNFEGPVLIVSHMDEFVSSLKLDDEINLGKY